MSSRHRTTDRRTGERGSATVFFLVTTAAIITALGLAADVGETLAASAQVTDESEQAARVAAEQLNLAYLRVGRIEVDRSAATAAAETYLHGFGDTGTVAFEGRRVIVTARRPVLVQFLAAFGVPGLAAKGSGAAIDVPGVAKAGDVPAIISQSTRAPHKAQP